MNLILFENREVRVRISGEDPRAGHLRTVLRPEIGETIDVGCLNGPRGKATVLEHTPDGSWVFDVHWGSPPPELEPVDLIVGLPRPQTARKILNTATTMGIRSLHFFCSEKGEPAYRNSRLWQSGEWQRHLRDGAEQAFSTRIPTVRHHDSLEQALREVPSAGDLDIALDLYEAEGGIRSLPAWSSGVRLAIGPERGWSRRERDCLRAYQLRLISLGERVLRTETACAFAMGCIQGARRG